MPQMAKRSGVPLSRPRRASTCQNRGGGAIQAPILPKYIRHHIVPRPKKPDGLDGGELLLKDEPSKRAFNIEGCSLDRNTTGRAS